MRSHEFITENSTLTLWHGGNLTDNLSLISQKKGRFEYGSGLYATTHYGTAIKYAKGSRKLYRIVLNKGTSANDHDVNFNDALSFVDQYVLKAKRGEVKQRMEKFREGDGISAYIFNNIVLNNDAIKPTNTQELSQFLVNQGIDYLLVPNAFGWGEMMVVIFNLNKIASVNRVMPKEKIDQFDLPTEFTEPIDESKEQFTGLISDIVSTVPNAIEIWFHGSRARGTHRQNSDWDIQVIVPDDVRGGPYMDVLFALQDLEKQYPNFDLQPGHIGDLINRIAREEGKLIWAKNNNE